MRVAITGATGFIGRQVLVELKKYCVDLVVTVQNKNQLKEFDSSIDTLVVDISNPPKDVFNDLSRPDVLIHLAWNGLPNYKSLHHMETELPNHYNFLANLVKSGLPAIVATGTCLEYGMQCGALSENMETKPNNPYGYAKNALRQQLELLRTAYPFAFTWARLFYIFGERQSESSLFSQLRRSIEYDEPRFDMSGGEQLRDYLPLNRVAEYLVALSIQRPDIGIVNICSGKPISVRALVEGWLRENNWKIELNLGQYDYPDYEPMAFWGDCSKLITFLKQNNPESL